MLKQLKPTKITVCRVRNPLIVAFAVILVFSLYLGSTSTKGGVVAPLDDAYIHYQYARQASAGNTWQYNDGDKLSSGATSFLYPFIIATVYTIGFQDKYVPGFAILLGAICFLASLPLVYACTKTLIAHLSPSETQQSEKWGLITTLLFLLTGALQFAYFNGMETGVFSLLLLASLTALLYQRLLLSAALIAAASLIRPEGIFLSCILFTAVTVDHFRHTSTRKNWRLLVFVLILAVGFTPYIVNFIITGSFVASGASAKSWLANVPFRFWDIVASIVNEFIDILARMSIASFAPTGWWIPIGVLPLALVGWYSLSKARQQLFTFVSIGWTVVGIALSAILITAIWHNGRYQAPYLVLLFPVVGVGLYKLLTALRRYGLWLPSILLAIFFLYACIGTFQSLKAFRKAVLSTKQQQIAIGEWIDRSLDDDALVAVHDAGAIRFVGNRATLDMIGLTSQGYAPLWREGIGAVYEKIESEENRPTHFATYPDVFSLSYLNGTDMFANEVYRADVADWSTISSAESVQVVYEACWEKANKGNTVHQLDIFELTDGLEQIAQIDVADLKSEVEYGFHWWESSNPIGFPTIVDQFDYIGPANGELLDGGRLLTGGISFDITSDSQAPITLVARLHTLQPNAFSVGINDVNIGEWRFMATTGDWLESYFNIAPEHIIEGENRITMGVVNPSEFVGLYHLWAYRGQRSDQIAQQDSPSIVRFEGGVDLIDSSINADTVAKGDIVEVELIWTASEVVEADAKVFVHLYSPSGELIAQSDGYPVYGTRPPYTWYPDEALADIHRIQLSSELENGVYEIAAGLYDPVSGNRIRILSDNACQLPDSRACLFSIELVD